MKPAAPISYYQKTNTGILAIATISLFIDVSILLPFVKLRPFDLLFGLVVFINLINGFFWRLSIKHAWLYAPYIIFIAYVFINCLLNTTVPTLAKEIAQFIEYLVYASICANTLATKNTRLLFMQLFTIGIGLVAFYTAIYHIVVLGSFFSYKELPANKYSFALLSLFLFWWYFIYHSKKRIVLLLLVISLVLTVFSGERKGWIAFIFAIAMLPLLEYQSWSLLRLHRKSILRLIGIAVSASLFFVAISALNNEGLNKQIFSLIEITDIGVENYNYASTASNRERLYLIGMAITLFLKNPWLGMGIDGFASYLAVHSLEPKMVQDVHNYYLKILVELGVVGLIFFTLVLTTIWRLIFKIYKTSSNAELKAYTKLLFMLFIFGSLENFFLSGKAIAIFYFAFPLGFAIALYKKSAQIATERI